ncbi:hypothetical protein [Duganella sp. P38]|uniref:hypothetical protein n=1 Tax=Duganella sp. P38 TaxID=3423949 RepID=UPI003D78BACD
MKPITLLSALAWALAAATGAAHADGLTSSQLGLVVNDDEPNSVAIAELYRVAHEIPAKNIAHVRIPNKPHRLTPAAFEELKKTSTASCRPRCAPR